MDERQKERARGWKEGEAQSEGSEMLQSLTERRTENCREREKRAEKEIKPEWRGCRAKERRKKEKLRGGRIA